MGVFARVELAQLLFAAGVGVGELAAALVGGAAVVEGGIGEDDGGWGRRGLGRGIEGGGELDGGAEAELGGIEGRGGAEIGRAHEDDAGVALRIGGELGEDGRGGVVVDEVAEAAVGLDLAGLEGGEQLVDVARGGEQAVALEGVEGATVLGGVDAGGELLAAGVLGGVAEEGDEARLLEIGLVDALELAQGGEQAEAGGPGVGLLELLGEGAVRGDGFAALRLELAELLDAGFAGPGELLLVGERALAAGLGGAVALLPAGEGVAGVFVAVEVFVAGEGLAGGVAGGELLAEGADLGLDVGFVAGDLEA
jgi:hypothetical protein